MKKFAYVLAGCLLIVLVFRLTRTNPPDIQSNNINPQTNATVHLHAGFQIYLDNTLLDFSGLKYMHLKPCTVDGQPDPNYPEDEQLEKAHLHNNIGDVVHVHRPHVVWNDVFQNLDIVIDASADAYLNGKQVTNIFDTPINSYDSLVIFQGNPDGIAEKLSSQVTKDKILQVENMPESCGTI